MNCRRVEQQLSDHLEGRLTEREADAVARHLGGCPACRQRQETFAALGPDLRGLADLLPPPDMARRAITRWAAEQASQATDDRRQTTGRNSFHLPFLTPDAWRLSPARLAPAGAALAAGALVAALGLALGHRNHTHTRVPTPLVARDHPAPRIVNPDEIRRPGPNGAPQRPPEFGPSPAPLVAMNTGGFPGRDLPPLASDNGSRSPSPLGSGLPKPASSHPGGDMDYLNNDPIKGAPQWVHVPPDEWAKLEAKVRENYKAKDDFVQIPFPRIVANSGTAVVAAVEAYKREAAIIDPRLVREVTLQFKGTALSDLCDRLRADAGIQVAAGRSVADEKVTLFCQKQPLRDVMRQLSRPFGYTWLRSGKPGDYRYELVQDLRSQLTEEELRNQDRNAALLAVEKDLDRYRPYLSMSPDEALARWKTASPEQKKLFEVMAGKGWGLIQMYFRLSPQELAALRSGQRLSFSEGSRGSERPLPKYVAHGVIESLRFWKVIKGENGPSITTDLSDPRGRELDVVPEVKAKLFLDMPQSELGQFRLGGAAGFYLENSKEDMVVGSSTPLAVGVSPAVLQPENAAANAKLATDPALRPRVSVQPAVSDVGVPSTSTQNAEARPPSGEKKITSADALEALHRATGMPIVAHYYTRLYKPESVTVRNRPLFETLNQVGDALHMRWNKEGGWLQFRSTSYFNDRLKEVPNRLLNRWAAARRQHGALSLDDLVEIAQLPDAQLDAKEMAEGVKELYGLQEWDLACFKTQRPHLRFLAGLSPAQREAALSAEGLTFTKMSLGQQQQFITFALQSSSIPLQSLDELAGATLRVDYSLPGWFQWGDPARTAYTQWVVPLQPGPQGKRVPRPVVRAKSRDAAMQALRQVAPQLRESLWQAMRRADPRLPAAPPDDAEQIFPTQLRLAVVYIPGGTNARDVRVLFRDNNLVQGG